MAKSIGRNFSRRDFIRMAAGTAAVGPFFLFPDRALANQKTVKIAKWAHFLPEFDSWFEASVAEGWGKKNETKVIVDHIPVEQVSRGHRRRSRPARAMMSSS